MINSPKDVQNSLRFIKNLKNCVEKLSSTFKGGGRQFYDKLFSVKIMTNSYL